MNCPLCKRPTPSMQDDPDNLCKWHRHEADKQIKRNEGIARESEKRAKETAKYNKDAAEYKRLHPKCEAKLVGCTINTEDIHHKRGKIGKLLRDQNHFLACCRHCHNTIEANPLFAKMLGLSENRLTIDL